MNSECLKKNNTWVAVDKPQNKKIIDVKWVYKRKSDDSLKARLVVRGFQQRISRKCLFASRKNGNVKNFVKLLLCK